MEAESDCWLTLERVMETSALSVTVVKQLDCRTLARVDMTWRSFLSPPAIDQAEMFR